MSPQQQLVPHMRFEVGSDMGRLWIALRDQRKHERAEVLAGLQAQDPEQRLVRFKHHGEFPREGQLYRYTVHDDGKVLCLEAHKIVDIP
jgi:hypothetical protein